MFGLVLVALAPLLLYLPVRLRREPDRRILVVLLIAYGVRMGLSVFGRYLPVFSYGAGGDYRWYEELATAIWQMWQQTELHYFTADEFASVGPTSLPPNLFAFIYYLNGEPTRIGCCAVIALAGCLTCFTLHGLAIDLGANREKAFRVFVVMLFGPAFLLYTSDVYKDGLVLFFVVTAFVSAIRLSRKFSPGQLVLGAMSCFALYFCRYYLIFVTTAPLFIALVGWRSKSVLRPLIATLLLVAGLLLLLTYTDVVDRATDTANQAFFAGTNRYSLEDNSTGGSGVVFDDGGSPYAALPLKSAYTLFSPFPWQAGSLALQFGKIEACLWYYFFYRAVIAARRLWTSDRTLLMMFITFLVPTSLMYALIMTNIGLIVRERMPIVMIGTLLGTLSWPQTVSEPKELEKRVSPRREAVLRLASRRQVS